MKTAFYIPPIAENTSDLHLLAELGDNEISVVIYACTPLVLHGFYMYRLENITGSVEYVNEIKDIFSSEKVFQQEFASKNILYNCRSSMLVPEEYFSAENKETHTDLMFGKDNSCTTFYDDVKEKKIKLVYQIHKKVHEIANEIFPEHIAHATSLHLQESRNEGNVLQCIVYQNRIKVLLFKENDILLVQYFVYNSPADVCYHLLNVCERFNESPDDMQIKLCGMIDENSNLYSEIYKYFLQVSFLSMPAGTALSENLQVHPQHYYAHLTALAQCV